jgi:glutamate formiminotransferase
VRRSAPQLHAGVVGLARAALARVRPSRAPQDYAACALTLPFCSRQLDLRAHATSHPRLGVVDHISVHALPPGGGASRDASSDAHDAAAALAVRLGGALASPPAPLPVYYYGGASAQRRGLADVRRSLGYFGANGGVAKGRGFMPPPGAPPPDAGPADATEAAGVRSSRVVLAWITGLELT